MRTTQFIGLTDKCKEQVEGLTAIQAKGWATFGMFNEDIPLSLFYNKDGSLYAVEFVQACPWSSGPMIFTGLMTANGPSPDNWVEDASVRGQEFDPTSGKFYV